MKLVEKYIAPLVENQFPDFFKEQGPLFILFVEEYFRWLETNNPDYATYEGAVEPGNMLYHLRRLSEYKDFDKTVDSFLIHFKEKYLKNYNVSTASSQRRLLKAAQDMFTSKGTSRSLDLLFKLVYGVKIEIETPGDFILKPSDGIWVIPKYLELSQSSRSTTFVGKQVYGSISGATAFVEQIITRNVNGKFIDIAFISNLSGNFSSGEYISNDGIIENAPKLVGSLSDIDLTTPGELFTVGEIVNIVSSNGTEGQARVVEISAVTGIVRFSIIDGGWGYANTADTYVSNKLITYSSRNNSTGSANNYFLQFETIAQNLYSFSLTNVIGSLKANTEFRNGNNASAARAVCVAVQQGSSYTANSANVTLNLTSQFINVSNIFSNNILLEVNKAIIATNTSVAFTIGDVLVQSNGSGNNTLGTVSNTANVTIVSVNTSTISTNGIHVGTFVQQTTTGASGYIKLIPRENLYNFTTVNVIAISNSSGTWNNTSTINIYSDSTKVTLIDQIDPLSSQDGYLYELINTNLTSNTRWATGNTVIKQGTSTNTVIKVAADVGGTVSTSVNRTATGINIKPMSNGEVISLSGNLGLVTVTNQFYATGNTIVYGLTTNTYANSIALYSGQNANFEVGTLVDSETVRISPNKMSSNNDGLGSSSIKFKDMVISGLNSTYGYIDNVVIVNGGSGYSNTDIIRFVGGNTGGHEIGNCNITTDAAGIITAVTVSSNVGSNLTSSPTITILDNLSAPSTGNGASFLLTYPLGFPKSPLGTIETPLQDLLDFYSLTIGTIATLTGINPGEQYTADPVAIAHQPDVAGYGARDHNTIFRMQSSTQSFNINEVIEQTVGLPSRTLIINNYSSPSSLSAIAVSNVGGSYVNGNIVTISGGTGTSANVLLTTNATGNVTSASLIIGQKGNYTSNPTLIDNTPTGGSGTGLTLNLTMTSNTNFEVGEAVSHTIGANTYFAIVQSSIFDIGSNSFNVTVRTPSNIFNTESFSRKVASVTVNSAGSGFTVRPLITISGGGGLGATATATAKLVSANVAIDGTGYINNEIVTVSGGTGTQANVSVTTDATGNVTSLSVVSGQSGSYTVLPALANNAPTGGSGSGLQLNLSFGLNTVTVTANGSGFLTTPSVIVSGSGGSGANATAVLNTATILGSTTKFQGSLTSAYTNTSSSSVKGRIVRRTAGTGTLQQYTVKRISLFGDFTSTGTYGGTTYGPAVGKTSGVSANVFISRPIGDIVGNNAIISGNVVSSVGSISSIEVVDSGAGYIQDETIILRSLDGEREATGKANILTQGTGTGRYASSRGFLDDTYKIHDGDYYQDYSYVINTTLPFNTYADLVKEVMHIAGKKMFGQVTIASVANTNITSNSTLTIS